MPRRALCGASACSRARPSWPPSSSGCAVRTFGVAAARPRSPRSARRRVDALARVTRIRRPTGLRITVLDVGQGDAILLQVPEGAVLVDEGPPEADVARPARRARASTSSTSSSSPIPSATMSAAPPTCSRPPRSEAVFDPGIPADSEYERRGARRSRASATCRCSLARAGRRFSLGRLRVRVLWPGGRWPPGDDPNNHAVVLVASLRPDRRAPDRRCRGRRDGADPTASRRDPQGRPPRLRRTRSFRSCSSSRDPQIAVVSVGRDNDYGHPTPSDPGRAEGLPGPGRLPHRPRRAQSRSRPTANGSRSRTSADYAWHAVAESELLPIYLLTGGDRPKIRRALERLRARFGAESIETLTAESTSGDEAVAALNSLGLFAGDGGRLVDRRGRRALEEGGRGGDRRLRQGSRPGRGARARRRRAEGLVAARASAPRPARCSPSRCRSPATSRPGCERSSSGSASRRTARPRARWSRSSATTRPRSRRRSRSSPPGPAGRAGRQARGRAPRRSGPGGLRLGDHGRLGGPRPPRRADRVPVGPRARRRPVRRSRCASRPRWRSSGRRRRSREEGLGVKDIAKRLRKHEFRVRKALGHADNYTRDELDEAVIRLAALDAALKGASRLAGELELERTIVELVREPGDGRASLTCSKPPVRPAAPNYFGAPQPTTRFRA